MIGASSRSDQAIDPLIRALKDEDSTVRANAALALGRMNTVEDTVYLPRLD
jgi:HEAT repeat protein